jgi:hypothetical protein
MDYLIEHEDEQITVIELIDKMSEFSGDMAYTSVHMKSKLQDYFGDNVIIQSAKVQSMTGVLWLGL